MARKKILYVAFFFAVAIFCNCESGNTSNPVIVDQGPLKDLKKDITLKYAKRFSISENQSIKVLYLFGNVNIKDTTAIYIFLKNSSVKLHNLKNTFVLKSPCKNIASLSSVYTTMLCELNEIGHISAIDNIDYYNNLDIINKYNKHQLVELVKNPEIDLEKTIVLNPDIIFTFGMGNSEKGPDQKISRANIPMVVAVDHLEETPLARAEWIKFFAVFVNKKQKADSVFNLVEKNYMELKKIASTSKTKPSVFTEIKYGDIWYVPGGQSFAAAFFKDANANYVWNDNLETGSRHLGFEEVYSKAQNADFWLNLSLIKSKKELYSIDKRYSEFKAFKTGSLFNNNKITNKKGYSTYWETGIMCPDKILSDLILIFHPELRSNINRDFHYYKKLD